MEFTKLFDINYFQIFYYTYYMTIFLRKYINNKYTESNNDILYETIKIFCNCLP